MKHSTGTRRRRIKKGSGRRGGDVRARIQRLVIDAIPLSQETQVDKLLAELTRLLLVAQDVCRNKESATSQECVKIRHYRQAAMNTYASEQIEFDDLAPVSMSDHGAFVQAWVWVSKREIQDHSGIP